MEAFGVPSIIVSLILGATERFIVTQSLDKKTIKFKTIMSKIIVINSNFYINNYIKIFTNIQYIPIFYSIYI